MTAPTARELLTALTRLGLNERFVVRAPAGGEPQIVPLAEGDVPPTPAEIEQAVAAARRAETAADPTDRTWSFEQWQF